MSELAVQQKQKFSVAISTDAYKKLINNTLNDPERAKRFVASITSAVAVNPDLQECDPGSILAAGFLGESLNLTPSPQLGHYYMVPFNQKIKQPGQNGKDNYVQVKKAQFVLGYKGFIQLALRSGFYKDLDVMEIHEGEYIGRDSENGRPKFRFIEDDDEREEAPVVGYMAFFEYLNGFRKVIYWTKKRMLSHADKYSPSFSAEAYKRLQNGEIPQEDMWKYSSFWYKSFDDMAKKTMLRQLISKWGVMSSEMEIAYTKDEQEPEEKGLVAEGTVSEPVVVKPEPEAISLKDLE